MSTGDEFDRDRLRRDPAGFFGLGDGFVRRDLRRAFHAAIRRFRPESHPREFQLLREAFERLDREARWREGRPEHDPGPTTFVGGPTPRARSLATATERERTFRELSASPSGPEEFVALALMADTVPAGQGRFEEWILRGLAAHPDDDGLEALLRVYQQEDLPDDDAPRFLVAAAAVLPPPMYWPVTARSWETAARTLPFPGFLRLWKRCERPADSVDEGPRAALLCYLLPVLAPGADLDWIERTHAWLSKRHDLLRGGDGSLDAVEEWLPLRRAMDEGDRVIGRREWWARAWRRLAGRPVGPPRFPRGPGADTARELMTALLVAGNRDGEARLTAAAAAVIERRDHVAFHLGPARRDLVAALRRLPRIAALTASHLQAFEPIRDHEEEATVANRVHRAARARLRFSYRSLAWRWLVTPALVALGIGILIATPVVFIFGLVGLRQVFTWSSPGVALGGALKFLLACALAWFVVRFGSDEFNLVSARVAARGQRIAYGHRVRIVAINAVCTMGLSPVLLEDETVVRPVEREPILARGLMEDPALHLLHIARRYAP